MIKTEFNPSCLANFEMIAGVRAFELNFESNQAVVIAGQNVVTGPINGTQLFFRRQQRNRCVKFCVRHRCVILWREAGASGNRRAD